MVRQQHTATDGTADQSFTDGSADAAADESVAG